jgi:hypothetical protein
MSGDAYVDIPTDESFVKALLTEVGLLDAGKIIIVNVNRYYEQCVILVNSFLINICGQLLMQ